MTTRRTIRIEVTDQSDELEDHFTGPREREQATLVREFAMTMGHDLSPAQVVDRIRGWLDKPPVVGPDEPVSHAGWFNDLLDQIKRESKPLDDGDEINRCQAQVVIDSHWIQCGMGKGHSSRHCANPLHGDGSTVVGPGFVQWGGSLDGGA